MIQKQNLEKNAYYLGYSNKTNVAFWDGENFRYFSSDNTNIGYLKFMETEDNGGFTPIKRIINLLGYNLKDNPNKTISGEIWKGVVGYEKLYEVSNYGRVRRYVDHKIMSSSFSRDYLVLGLTKNKVRKTFRIHRLVAAAFIKNDDPENKLEVNHINGVKTDNKVENLEWVTREENAKAMLYTGNYMKKFTPEFINKIREELNIGKKRQIDIATMYNISQSMVSEIKNNKKWKI